MFATHCCLVCVCLLRWLVGWWCVGEGRRAVHGSANAGSSAHRRPVNNHCTHSSSAQLSSEPAHAKLDTSAHVNCFYVTPLLLDSISAKFVWKRIPVDLRNRSQLLTQLWQLLSTLYQHQTTSFYTLLHHTTLPTQPPTTTLLADLLSQLHRHTQSAACAWLEAVYDSIELDEARRMCDMVGDEAGWGKLVEARGWAVEGGYVRLRRVVKERGGAMGLEELDRLTRYVTELEQ